MVHDERSPTGTTSEWPAKQKCRPARADAGIEVGDVVGAGLAEIHALAAEAERRQGALEMLQGAGFARRHAFAAHQRARQFDHIGDVGSQGIGHDATLHPRPAKEKGAGPARPTPQFM